MKHIFLILGISLGMTVASKASFTSEQLAVDRYTILDDGTIEYDSGNLLDSGDFRVIGSQIFTDDPTAYIPVNGRPILWEAQYNAYESGGLIPNWTRSTADFYINYIPYVIVSVKGGEDPNPLPIIVNQPQSQDVLLGEYTALLVSAEPLDSVSYQWQFAKKGTKFKTLPGENSFLLVFANVTAADAGSYRVEVSEGGAPVVSETAVLNVIIPIAIKKQPQPRLAKAGGSATFQVSVTGTSPTYQWYFNGNPIPGATAASYSVKNVTAGNVGTYAVIIENEFSSVSSSRATLGLK